MKTEYYVARVTGRPSYASSLVTTLSTRYRFINALT